MALLGLILLIVVVVVAATVLLHGSSTMHVDLGWFDFDTDVRTVFLAGAITLLVALLGIWLAMRGLQRSRERRAEVKQLRKKARAAAAADTAAPSGSPARPSETGRPSSQKASSAPGPPVGGATSSGSGPRPTGGATSASAAGTSPTSRTDEGPDEHFESAPREA